MNRLFAFVFIVLCILPSDAQAGNPRLDSRVVCRQPDLNVPVHECEALIKIYNALLLDSRYRYDWTGPNVFDWRGVGAYGPRVQAISLWVHGNNNSIPDAVGDLSELISFILEGDGQLHGSLPSSMADLSRLRMIHISGLKMQGTLPEFVGEINSLTDVTFRDLNLSGSIPSSWHSLSNIENLDLSGNKLSGELPSDFMAGSGSVLATVDISGNKLSGQLPEGLFNFRRLYDLNLSHNRFSGSLPESILNMKTHSTINLSNNSIGGQLPVNLQELAPKSVLLFLDNNNIGGEIPAFQDPENLGLGDVTFNGRLSISSNRLSGEIPEFFITSFRRLNLANNMLSGYLPKDFSKLSLNIPSRELDLSRNQLTGPIPTLDKSGDPVAAIDLSHNELSGGFDAFFRDDRLLVRDVNLSHNRLDSIPSQLKVSGVDSLNLSHNNLTGPISSIQFSEMTAFDISHNELSANDISLSGYVPRELTLADNNLSGAFPNLRVLCENRSRYSISLDFSNNGLVGEMSEDAIEPCGNLKLNADNNRLHGELSGTKGELRSRSISYSILSQKPYLVQPGIGGLVDLLAGKNAGNHVYSIRVPEGQKLVAVEGCEGRLNGTIFKLSGGQPACNLAPVFEDCGGVVNCLSDYGSFAGVQNARIESPAAGLTLSGVVQFRGWLHESEMRRYKSYDARRPRKAKLLIDGSEIPLDVNFNRLDVASAMGYKQENQIPVGWSALFYAGNLSNGLHTASLVSHEGAVVDTLSFNSFTLQDESGKALYIRDNNRELVIEDFPFLGSDIVARFNSNEQSFSIVDQLRDGGSSSRSPVVHYLEDDLVPQNSGLINGVAQVKIETPNRDNDLLGVASLRGWAYGSDLLNGPLYMSLDDGEPFLLPRGERSDVENAMGISTSVKVGWSQLFYAGNLENGYHRLRLYGEQGESKVLLAQSFFESFVPLDKQGKPVYIQAAKKTMLNDFPYAGSKVELSFDKAGQNFVPVSQVVQ